MTALMQSLGLVIYRTPSETFSSLRSAAQNVRDHFIPHARNNYHPHILGHKVLGLFSLLMITVKVCALALPILAIGPVDPAQSSAITVQNVFSLTNTSRGQNNLNSLTLNGKLMQAAQAKADDMLAKSYFSHTTPEGYAPWKFIKETGYSYVSAGENLAVDFSQAESVDSAWMQSPGHRANILNKDFEEIGIGISSGEYHGHQTIFVVQMFGTPISQSVAVKEQPSQIEPQAQSSEPANLSSAPPINSESPIQPDAASKQSQTKPQPSNAPIMAIVPQPAQQLQINQSEATLTKNGLSVNVTSSTNAVRVLAVLGDQSFMLDPKSEINWSANIPLASLPQGKQQLIVRAYDAQGGLKEAKVMEFSPTVAGEQTNQPSGHEIKIFGNTISVNVLEKNIYLVFIAAMLSCLLIAITVHHKIQHIGMVGNASFVTIIATLLWMGA